MNKQIISLMCIAVLLALGLVLANEKWPDGYRTAPQLGAEVNPVGAVVKGAVTLPEQEKPVAENSKDTDKVEETASASPAPVQSQEEKTSPQGELVAIDNGTLHSDIPAMDTKAAPKVAEPAKQEADNKSAQANAPAPKEDKPKQASNASLGTATPKVLLYTKEAVLEVKATAPIRCKTFRLTSPDRLVVDLIGKWDVPSPAVPSNTIIQRIRIGDATERTRIVLDLKRPLQSDKIVQVNATTLNIRMQ